MKDQSLEMLEFPKVKDILAGYTSFSISREMVMGLSPSADIEKVLHWLKQSAEARHLLSFEPDLTIGAVYDIREMTTLAARGKTLELQTLADIQRTLVAMRLLRSKLSRMLDEAPILANLSAQITPFARLENEIERCVSPAGELLDSASERLTELRHLLKEKRSQILSQLDTIIKSPDNDRYIQEQIVTERNGRYVIPVKIDLRREVKGIVHDVSNTGATAFVEPISTVDLGNELREMVIEEQREVERILASLSSEIGAQELAIIQNLKLIGEIDVALAKARYAERIRGVEPLIGGIKHEKESPDGQRVLRVINARHPLLKGNPVPLTLEIGKDFNGLVITGPNTGGKTVALKTVGLLALMAQSGIPIPAAYESCIPIFDNIFADIGDEQSIEHTLSSFSWHMGNIVRILRESTERSLVLLDELGTSTDPAEGAALAQSILLHFLKQRTMVVATTHFGELKAFAHATDGLQNASLDFDPVTFKPSYHLTLGIPGGSNALAIASQLGLPEEIIERARERLSRGAIEIEALLTDLMTQKQTLEAMRGDIEKSQSEAEDLRKNLQKERQEFADKEQHILDEIRQKLVHKGDELLKEIRDAMAELKKARSEEKLERARKALATMREELKSPLWQSTTNSPEKKPDTRFAVGDKVRLKGMNLQGTVISVSDRNGQFEIQVGTGKFKLFPENFEKVEQAAKAPVITGVARPLPRKVVSRELDLRGKRADQVEGELDSYLNDASLSSLNEIRIIHGIATGTVRQIVRQFLASHPLVSSFRSGKKEEGGDGVTMVQL